MKFGMIASLHVFPDTAKGKPTQDFEWAGASRTGYIGRLEESAVLQRHVCEHAATTRRVGESILHRLAQLHSSIAMQYDQVNDYRATQ